MKRLVLTCIRDLSIIVSVIALAGLLAAALIYGIVWVYLHITVRLIWP